jgi:hypothetical protein
LCKLISAIANEESPVVLSECVCVCLSCHSLSWCLCVFGHITYVRLCLLLSKSFSFYIESYLHIHVGGIIIRCSSQSRSPPFPPPLSFAWSSIPQEK